jgi:hypothetical protein
MIKEHHHTPGFRGFRGPAEPSRILILPPGWGARRGSRVRNESGAKWRRGALAADQRRRAGSSVAVRGYREDSCYQPHSTAFSLVSGVSGSGVDAAFSHSPPREAIRGSGVIELCAPVEVHRRNAPCVVPGVTGWVRAS